MPDSGVYQVLVEVIDPEGNRVSKSLAVKDAEITQSRLGPWMQMRILLADCTDAVTEELKKTKGWRSALGG